MGLFGKIKNIFYDVEEVEVPVKEEKEEVAVPKIEELNIEEKEIKPEINLNDTVSERELFKSKNTFNFPIFEADEEEEKIPKVEPTSSRVRESNTAYYEESRRKERYDIQPEAPKQSRVFTPSPVISPVYGILDKNYKREEIIEKRETYTPKPNEKNYDYVRRKAFGTLEDELENTLTKIETKSALELTQDLTETIENIETTSKNIEDLLAEVDTSKVTVGEVEENYKDKIEAEEKDERLDNTLEHDLFNLIDSMYESKEE